MAVQLAYGHHEDRTPIYGYEATRQAAMAAFAKSWRRGIRPPRHWRGPLARNSWVSRLTARRAAASVEV